MLALRDLHCALAVVSANVLLAPGFEAALGMHTLWAIMLLAIVIHGPGALSVDGLLARARTTMSTESWPKDLELLRVTDEGVAGETGAGFFRSLVMAMVRALDVHNAFACEFNADRSIALIFAEWKHGCLLEEVTPFAIAGTLRQLTLAGDIVAIEDGVTARFPDLAEMNAESYLAIPLKSNQGEVVGHLASIDTRPRCWCETDCGILRIFAAPAVAEIERRRFERDLEKAKRVPEHAKLAKSQFLAHMSQAIRTPLNATFGYAQLWARTSALNPTQSHALDQITQAGEHLLGLINDLLDLAKIESGRVDLALEPIDLASCIEHAVAVAIARLRAEQSGLSFFLCRHHAGRRAC